METPKMDTNASITPSQCQALADMFGALHLVSTAMTRLPTTLRLEAEPYVNAVQSLEETFTVVLKEGQIWQVTNPEWYGDDPATVGHLSLHHCGVLYQVIGDLRLIVESIADLPSLLVDEFDQYARTLDLVAGSLECFFTDSDIWRFACDSVEINLPGVKKILHYRPQSDIIERAFSNFEREQLHAAPERSANATDETERAYRPQSSVIEHAFSNFEREQLHATPEGAANATDETERAHRPQSSVIEHAFSNFGREQLHATPARAPNATVEAERAARAKALGVPWCHRSRPAAIVIPARHYQKLARAASCLALLETTDNSPSGLKVKADLTAVAREAVEQAMVAARVWTRA